MTEAAASRCGCGWTVWREKAATRPPLAMCVGLIHCEAPTNVSQPGAHGLALAMIMQRLRRRNRRRSLGLGRAPPSGESHSGAASSSSIVSKPPPWRLSAKSTVSSMSLWSDNTASSGYSVSLSGATSASSVGSISRICPTCIRQQNHTTKNKYYQTVLVVESSCRERIPSSQEQQTQVPDGCRPWTGSWQSSGLVHIAKTQSGASA